MKVLDSKKKLKLISLFLGIGAILGVYLIKELGKGEVKREAPHQLWEAALDKTSRVWNGEVSLSDEHLGSKCPHLKVENDLIPTPLKACQWQIFKCYFEERSESLKYKNQFYNFKVIFPREENSYKTPSHKISIEFDNQKKDFELTNFCRQVELPQGVYWGNNKVQKEKRLWHTSGIRYFIDKYLIRALDVREWIIRNKEGVPPKLVTKYQKLSGEELFRPSVDLLPEMMKNFCKDRGLEVLSSPVRAALTFHHGRRNQDNISIEPPSYNSSPHPFGPRLQDSPQYLAEKKQKFELKDVCRKIFSNECLQKFKLENFLYGMGWLGVSELLGGPAEYVVNLEYPRKNLHPSSYYHPLSSKAHQAGERVFWSGQGHRRIDFNFFTTPFFEGSEDNYDVAFRCMKKVYIVEGR